jgi:FkbM family methyltransferase
VRSLIKALRSPLQLIPPETRVPILVGPLRGAGWIVGSGNHVVWLGVYEWQKQLAFSKRIAAGSTVYDIGAHAGFYTLVSSRRVGPTGHVVAFEPAQKNLRYLHLHIALNQIANVQVIEAAVADQSGRAGFAEGASRHVEATYLGHLAEDGTRDVETVSLDDLVGAGRIPAPDIMKMDIEGGETSALRGARGVLAEHRPTIFLATHGADAHRTCIALLESSGYEVASLQSGRSVATTDELVACPSERSPARPF